MPTLPARRYMPPPMYSRGRGSIADLLMQRGDIAARGAERSGQIWGGTVAGLGELAGQAIGQYGERKEEAERLQQQGAGIARFVADERWSTDPAAVYAEAAEALGQEPADRLVKSIQSFQELTEVGQQEKPDPDHALKLLGPIAESFLIDATAEERAALYPTLAQTATNAGVPLMQEWGPEWDESRLPLVEQFLTPHLPEQEEPTPGSREWYMGLPEEERPEARSVLGEFLGLGRAPRVPLGVIEAESAARARGTASVKTPEGDIDWTKTGEEFLATLPLERQATVQQLGEYRRRPSATLYRSEQGRRLLAQVSQFNREYDEKKYGEGQKAIGEYTSGATHRNIIAINTLSHHLVPFAEAADALNTNNVQALNRLRNYFLQELGSEVPTNFEALRHLVSDEIANTFKTTGATDSTIKNAAETVYAAQSPAQLLGGLRRLARLAEGRIRAIGNKYDVTFGEGAFDRKGYISDEARHAYEMIRGAGELGDIGEGRTTTGKGLEAAVDALLGLGLSPEELEAALGEP